MTWVQKFPVCVVALALAGCTSDGPTPPADKLILTTTQAAVLVSKAQLISGVNSELAWLADSISVVIKAGAEVRRISVVVDGVEKSYYAVGLTRQLTTTNSFSTFQLIAFDNVSSPVDFFLTNGYLVGSGAVAPSSMTGAFGTINAFAHVIHTSGATVTDWVAKTGTATFQVGPILESCQSTATITCSTAMLTAQATIALARPDANLADVHTAALSMVSVPGVLLVFH